MDPGLLFKISIGGCGMWPGFKEDGLAYDPMTGNYRRIYTDKDGNVWIDNRTSMTKPPIPIGHEPAWNEPEEIADIPGIHYT